MQTRTLRRIIGHQRIETTIFGAGWLSNKLPRMQPSDARVHLRRRRRLERQNRRRK